ncbi:HpcH/HpaI aldolase/citrate lyase family protein [Afifella pfennigii]|uniref:HpcH/HpaI aldolase/citrate lyase family protein n=1 Tax=Afifella pfennigii TaxID=209897 RepID=UPI00047D52AE|nr:CoA ester lyase [Afifella pfennigii]
MSFRSYLFVPADSPRKLARAAASAADALILDLEDAVAPTNKTAARDEVARFLARPAPMSRFVRVNPLASGLTEADVAATAAGSPQGYVLPKCEGPDDIEALAGLIAKHGGKESTGIMAIGTESVRGLRRLMREDWFHPRLVALTWGGEDLCADMGAERNRDEAGRYYGPFLMARDLTLLAALEAGVAPVDAVYTDFRDEAGLWRETRLAKALGFTGKMAIHPAQVPVIHRAFQPEPAEIRWAKAVIEALESAGEGVAELNGTMIDRPHLLRAHKILRLHAGAAGQAS